MTSGSAYDADKRLEEDSHWAAMLLLGQPRSHPSRDTGHVICISLHADLYVENYIKTRQYKTKAQASTWTYAL